MLITVLDQMADADDREERQQIWRMIRGTLAERLGVTNTELKRIDEVRSVLSAPR